MLGLLHIVVKYLLLWFVSETLCHRCGRLFQKLHLHLLQCKPRSIHNPNQPSPPKKDFPEDPVSPLKNLKDIYTNKIFRVICANWHNIRQRAIKGRMMSSYNLRWMDNIPPDWGRMLSIILDQQKHSFKINLSHSFILQNKKNPDFLKFHYSSFNNFQVFDVPKSIRSQSDINKLAQELEDANFLKYCNQFKPGSDWLVVCILSTTIYVWPIENFPIGCLSDPPPSFLTNNKGIITLYKSQCGVIYQDSLCFYRCVALHQGVKRDKIDQIAREIALLHKPSIDFSNFEGLTLAELGEAENFFLG